MVTIDEKFQYAFTDFMIISLVQNFADFNHVNTMLPIMVLIISIFYIFQSSIDVLIV